MTMHATTTATSAAAAETARNQSAIDTTIGAANNNRHHHHHKNNNNYEGSTPLLVRRTQSYDGVVVTSSAAAAAMDGALINGGGGGGEHHGQDNLLLGGYGNGAESPLHASFDVSQLTAYQSSHYNNNSSPGYHHPFRGPVTSTTKTPLRLRFPRSHVKASASSAVSSSSSSSSHHHHHHGNLKASGKRTPASARRHRLFSRRLSPAHRTPATLARPISAEQSSSQQQQPQHSQPQTLFPTPRNHHPPPPPPPPSSSPFGPPPLASSYSSASSSCVRQPPQPLFSWQQQHSINHWQSSMFMSMEDSSSLAPSPPPPVFDIAAAAAAAATPAPTKKAPKRSIGTVTTVANSTILETTAETDESADTHTAAAAATTNTFRFSSFPASLPRIPTTHTHPNASAYATRRRMGDFTTTTTTGSHANNPFDNTNATTSAAVLNFHPDEDELNTSSPSFSGADPPPPHHHHHGPTDHAEQFLNLEDFDDDDDDDHEMNTSPIGTPVGRRRLNFNSVLSPGNNAKVLPPGTPKDVKMHFQGGQCSPIRGIPEEDGDLTRSSEDNHHNHKPLNQSLASTNSNSNSSGNSSQARSRRPMPDMNAFEGDVSQDHSADHGSSSRSHPSSPKLLCPPTPVRTPAWVHAPTTTGEKSGGGGSYYSSATSSYHQLPQHHHHPLPHHKYGRQNSLIATKVLATCSQRDLEGRSSLENSLLDEESSKQRQQQQQQPQNDSSSSSSHANSSSILTFAESAAAATEPETDHPSSERDQSSQHHSGHNLDVDEDDHHQEWEQPAERHGKNRPQLLFQDDDDDDNDARQRDEAAALVSSTEMVSMSTSFDILGMLGRGTFADVFKVRSKKDGKLYAVKKHRRQFRGRRDREITLSEVRHMQRLQSSISKQPHHHHSSSSATAAGATGVKSSYSLYLLFFYQAWQEDGHFFCQTELCCRDTCREFMDALRFNWVTCRTRYPSLRRLPAPLGITAGTDQDIIGRLVPEPTIWKICHDISAGLSYIHSHGLVHHDIKPSNIFLASHHHFGAMCKIGDFGMAGDIGTSEDGQEGDQKYMAPELLSSDVKHPSSDMFSLGLTLYELASSLSFEVPSEGQLWHDLRRPSGGESRARHWNNINNNGAPPSSSFPNNIPSSRDPELVQLIRQLMCPDQTARLSAEAVLRHSKVQQAGAGKDEFLMAYIHDVEEYEQQQQTAVDGIKTDDQTPRVLGRPRLCVSPSLTIPTVPLFFSSPKHAPPYA